MRDAVVERWGAEVAPGGTVDRAAVARRAFADPSERAWLEGLLWPRVGAEIAVAHDALGISPAATAQFGAAGDNKAWGGAAARAGE